jgi:hypothetical protein
MTGVPTSTNTDRSNAVLNDASDNRSARPDLGGPGRVVEVVRRCGRFTLTKSPEGYRWIFTSRLGSVWHWHAEGKEWVVNWHAYRSEQAATANLEGTLAHEQAGDLDKQHAPLEPPAYIEEQAMK